MKKVLIAGALVAVAAIAFSFYAPEKTVAAKTEVTEKKEIKWYTWEEAMKANEENPKMFFIDVYTDWCGWCKRMDATTFQEPEVVQYLTEKFYPVKFDAEQEEPVQFDNNTFNFVKAGRRGYHQLAAALLDGQMSYPSYVFLNKDKERITILKGYRQADQLMPVLKYIGEEHYKDKTFKEYTGSK
jgi:thioredoxin-related protein